MVRNKDVRVPVPTHRVGVYRDEVISRMHPFSEFHCDVAYTVEVGLLGDIELFRTECQSVRLKLILAPMCSCETLCALYELLGCRTTVGHLQR